MIQYRSYSNLNTFISVSSNTHLSPMTSKLSNLLIVRYRSGLSSILSGILEAKKTVDRQNTRSNRILRAFSKFLQRRSAQIMSIKDPENHNALKSIIASRNIGYHADILADILLFWPNANILVCTSSNYASNDILSRLMD